MARHGPSDDGGGLAIRPVRLRRTRAARRGASLLETIVASVVVAAIGGIILLAAWRALRPERELRRCTSNLRLLHRLILLYTVNHGGYLPSFWRERWVEEMGLCGHRWPPGNLPHDLPRPVWDSVGAPDLRHIPLVRSGAPFLVCPIDTGDYRCTPGCRLSYTGLAKYGWWWRPTDIRSPSHPRFEYRQIQELDRLDERRLLVESVPFAGTSGGASSRYFPYGHPLVVSKRHWGGGNILFVDGHTRLATGDERRLRRWEPDLTQFGPQW